MIAIFLYLLIISIGLLLLLNIILFQRDLISPPIVVCAVFFLSSLCSLYNQKYWNFDLQIQTYCTIVYGLFLFSFFSFATQQIFKKVHNTYEVKTSGSQIIHIENYKLTCSILFVMIISIWYAFEIIRIAKRYGVVSSISSITSIYRRISSYGVLSVDDSVNFICKQLYKLVSAISYVNLYIFFNNTIITKKIKSNIKFLIPCIIYLMFSLISASRNFIINAISCMIFMYYILYYKIKFKKKNISFKFVISCFASLFAFCCVFFFTRELVGRSSNSDPIYYITSYAGGSIPLLDSFLQNPPAKSSIWGKETFYSINSFIGRYFNIEKLQYITHHEFRNAPSGMSMGNVYTVFRRMLYDFGYTGMSFLYSICAIIYTYIYAKIKYCINLKHVDLRVIFYSYISFGLTMQFYEESFYANIFSTSTLITFFLIYCYRFFLLRIKFGKN